MHRWAILSLLGISVLLHAFFAWHQSFTNDEGAYLYDARTLLEGVVPAGDVLTKAPVPIILFAVSEAFSGKSLFAARIVNSIASIVTVVPLFLLIKILTNKRAAEIGAVLWLLGSGTIIFHTVGHTQAIASLFAVTCLYCFIRGCRIKPAWPVGRSGMTKYIILAGVCFALAYASRKTALAVAVPMVLSCFAFSEARIAWRRLMVKFLFGVLIVLTPWFIWMYALYGASGIWHAVGMRYGDILVHSQSITPWAGSADRMLSEAIRIGGIYILLLTIILGMIVRGIVRRDSSPALLMSAVWIATLAILYAVWPTHLVEYLADFIPPIVIAGSLALGSLKLSKWQGYILVILFLGISFSSLRSVYIRPWTGMFTRDAVVQSSMWLRDNVSMNQEIFTAAVIVPYLSGHHVPFNLSHPQWYRYNFISQQDKSIFLPSYVDVQKVVNTQASWILRDQLTDYVYPDFSLRGFTEVLSIPNNTGYRVNPIRVYLKL